MRLSRRQFLANSTAALGSLALGWGCSENADPSILPDPALSGIEHAIVVMMENRSFDHLLGWLPGADGRQVGLSYRDANGVTHETHALAPDFQGCSYHDPDHSYAGGRVEYNNGACDGWLLANDVFSTGYYGGADLPFFGQAAPQWMTFDRYFCPFMGPTYPNRFYQHAAQTDRYSNLSFISTLPTIWDRLETAGIAGRYYYSDLPFLTLWGTKYRPISETIDAFYADCAAGTLPAVCFVEPSFLDETTGTGGDDHPHNDLRVGEAFLNRVYAAVSGGPGWKHSILFINFDEWGGFYDHVAPSAAPIPDADRAAGNSDGLRGFRTPALLISPFARRGYTSHTVYDHTSILRLIEWRWNLAPLSVRDGTANNLATELDFSGSDLRAPVYAVPDFTSIPCPAAATRRSPPSTLARWGSLEGLARQYGWA